MLLSVLRVKYPLLPADPADYVGCRGHIVTGTVNSAFRRKTAACRLPCFFLRIGTSSGFYYYLCMV
jgi:hypothetical protein